MKRGNDIFEIASVLDETIEKAERTYTSMPISELIERHQEMVALVKSCDDRAGREVLKSKLEELSGYVRRRQRAKTLAKALSFDPLAPVEMTQDQNYYSPYRQLSDGSYAPHSSGYWMEQRYGAQPDGEFGHRNGFDESEPQRDLRRDSYREVDSFYRQAGVMKAILDIEIDDLVKGVSPAKLKKPLEHHEKLSLIKDHIKKRKSKEKMEKEKALDKKIKEHVDSTLADHFETHKIKSKIHATMQKRLSSLGPQQRSALHQTASGMGRPATPEETKWSGMEPKTKAKTKPGGQNERIR